MKSLDYGIWISYGGQYYTTDQFITLLHQKPGRILYFSILVNGVRQNFDEKLTLKDLENHEVVGEFFSSMREWIVEFNYGPQSAFGVFHARMGQEKNIS